MSTASNRPCPIMRVPYMIDWPLSYRRPSQQLPRVSTPAAARRPVTILLRYLVALVQVQQLHFQLHHCMGVLGFHCRHRFLVFHFHVHQFFFDFDGLGTLFGS